MGPPCPTHIAKMEARKEEQNAKREALLLLRGAFPRPMLAPSSAHSHRSRLMPFIARREREGGKGISEAASLLYPSSNSPSLSLRGATAGEGASESVPTHSIAVVGDMVCVQLDLK